MGWAIRRPDGSYRAWNAMTQDDALLPGEVWEAMATAPVVSVPAGAPPRLSPRVTTDDVFRWVLDQVNEVRAGLPTPLPAIDVADARGAIEQLARRKER